MIRKWGRADIVFMVLPALLAIAAAPASAETPDDVARRYGLAGEVLVARGDRVVLDHGYGPIAPEGGKPHKRGERWRLASITKQVTAVATMRKVERGELGLDAPIAAYQGLTARMLLTHHTGLPNPDDTPKSAAGMPGFYSAARADLGYCHAGQAKPGAAFSYNNCDYLLLGELLEAGEGSAGGLDNALWPGHFATPQSQAKSMPGFVGGKPEPSVNLATFGTAGGLIGTARDVFAFDRALMTGKLLSPASLAVLWQPEGNGSYQALGQWVFPGSLKGCATPQRIVQRDGEIGGVQARNFIFPDDNLVVIVFTNRSSDDFKLGEVWEGKGFMFDLLSAVACS
jgi:D-alanyl-D-alanine carboxypeptidase